MCNGGEHKKLKEFAKPETKRRQSCRRNQRKSANVNFYGKTAAHLPAIVPLEIAQPGGPAHAKRFPLLGRVWPLQDRFFAGGGRGDISRGGFGRFVGGGSGNRGAAFGVGFLEEGFSDGLSAAGVVVGLFRFAVFVDGAFALAEQVKNLAKIDVAPDFGPLFGGFGNCLRGFAEGISGGRIVFLVEEGFTHTEIGEGPAGLNRERALILRDRVVKAALLGEILASSDSSMGTEGSASFENDVIGIDLDATGFRAAKCFHCKA